MIQPAHDPSAKLTADDRRDLPSDGKRWEILEGELVVSPAPNTRHQSICRRLVTRLDARLGSEGEVFFAPIDVVLDGHTVCQPDVVFVSRGRARIVEVDAIHGAPDVVIEILSPSTRRMDVVVKSQLYLRAGVGAYWIVDPDLDQVEIFVRAGGAWAPPLVVTSPASLEPPGIPGLSIPLRDIFGR